jgi:glycosyltransferase involved in cell wall biosynthesis
MAPLVRSRLIKEESAHRTTVLWGMDITQASLSAAFLHRLDSRLPLVLTVQYGETPARLASGRLGMIRRSFKHMLSCADRVTAVSTSLLDLAREHGYTGPALLIPNGVDLGRFRRPEGQPSPPHPTVITVSRLVNKNGLETLLRALPMVLHEYPALDCCVVGDGPQRPRLERLAAELGVANAVRFLGGVPHEDVPRHLWRGDVFVRPSRSEGMGTAFVEALAAGLPIIGTCVGGIADIIRDGETGLFAQVDEPADLAHKIRLLLADRGLAARLAEQGLAWVRDRYDAESVARRYSAVFEEALRG